MSFKGEYQSDRSDQRGFKAVTLDKERAENHQKCTMRSQHFNPKPICMRRRSTLRRIFRGRSSLDIRALSMVQYTYYCEDGRVMSGSQKTRHTRIHNGGLRAQQRRGEWIGFR